MATPLLAGPRWQACNLIRFKEGFLQKLGGCQRLTSNTFTGTCRGLHPFADLASNIYLGVGTEQRLQLYNNDALYDITPYRTITNTATFQTTVGSATVVMNDPDSPGTLPATGSSSTTPRRSAVCCCMDCIRSPPCRPPA